MEVMYMLKGPQYGEYRITWFNTAIKSLAIMASTNEMMSSTSLAEKLGVESSFIRKVLAKLMEDNLVIGFGGRYGGYKINADASNITIYHVYLALMKNSLLKDETLNINKTDRLMIQILEEAEAEFSKVLFKYTIADVRDTFK